MNVVTCVLQNRSRISWYVGFKAQELTRWNLVLLVFVIFYCFFCCLRKFPFRAQVAAWLHLRRQYETGCELWVTWCISFNFNFLQLETNLWSLVEKTLPTDSLETTGADFFSSHYLSHNVKWCHHFGLTYCLAHLCEFEEQSKHHTSNWVNTSGHGLFVCFKWNIEPYKQGFLSRISLLFVFFVVVVIDSNPVMQFLCFGFIEKSTHLKLSRRWHFAQVFSHHLFLYCQTWFERSVSCQDHDRFNSFI